MRATRWAITCDPGVDDAVALAVAAGRADIAVTAVVAGAGNVDAPTAWRNAVGLAVLAGLDAPVVMGSAVTVGGSPIHRDGSSHGADGLAGLSGRLGVARPVAPDPPAGAAPGPGTAAGPPLAGNVLAVGPLTDVALALRSNRPVDSVVWLGGTLTRTGDARAGAGPTGELDAPAGPGGEFNAAADPGAVAAVLAGVPHVRVVPIGTSGRVMVTPRQLDRWARAGATARLCADLVAARYGRAEGRLHDPVAAIAAAEPDLFRWEPLGLRCSTGGAHPPGTLVVDERAPDRALVAVGVDATEVAARITAAVCSAP